MTFNEKVDKFMKEKGIENLKQLALSSDIPYTTLRDFYEKRSADNSRLSTIRKLSRFMNCSMDYLAYDEIENISESKTKTDNNLNIDDNIDALLGAYKDLPDIDKEWVKNMVIERRKLIDKQLENDKD